MKKWILIAFAVCLLVVMMWKAGEKTNAPAQTTVDWGVTMTAKSPTATGCVLEITQSGGKPTGEVTCGCDYWLEQQKDGIWTKVEGAEGICWTMEGYSLSLRKQSFDLNWGTLYGTLPAGTYRVGKSIMDWRAPGDFDEADHFSQPFVIE